MPEPADDGYAWIEEPAEERVGWHLHYGARIRWAKPAWAKGKLLIHLMGGTAPEEGFEEEGAAFLIEPDALLALTDALFAVAFDAEPSGEVVGS